MVKASTLHLTAFVSLIAGIVIWILSAMAHASIHASRNYLSARSDGNSSIDISLNRGQLVYAHLFMDDSANSWAVDSTLSWEPGYHSDARLFAPLEFGLDGFPQRIRVGLPLWIFFPVFLGLWFGFLRRDRKRSGPTRRAHSTVDMTFRKKAGQPALVSQSDLGAVTNLNLMRRDALRSGCQFRSEKV